MIYGGGGEEEGGKGADELDLLLPPPFSPLSLISPHDIVTAGGEGCKGGAWRRGACDSGHHGGGGRHGPRGGGTGRRGGGAGRAPGGDPCAEMVLAACGGVAPITVLVGARAGWHALRRLRLSCR